VTHALSITFFPRWLGALETRLQHGPVQTFADHTQACEDLMAQRRVQFVLCYGHRGVPGRLDDGRYRMVALGEDTLIPVSAPRPDGVPQHALDRADTVATLDYGEASGLGRILRAQLGHRPASAAIGKATPRLNAVFTAHNAFLLKTMALSGRGVAWLPASLVADDLQRRDLVMAGDATWQVPVEVRLYRQNAQMAPTAEELWKVVGGVDGPPEQP